MKSIVTTLTLLASAPVIFAHTSLAPHMHEGTHTSWIPAVATLAALFTLVYVLVRRIRSRKAQRVSK